MAKHRAGQAAAEQDSGGRGLHILFATTTPLDLSRGDTIHVLELVRELALLGAKVTLIGSGRPAVPVPGVEILDAGRVHSCKALRGLSWLGMKFQILYHVFRLCREVDILYTRTVQLGWYFGVLRFLIRLPLIYEVNSLPADEAEMAGDSLRIRWMIAKIQWGERITFRHARSLICVTEGIKRVLEQEYGVPGEKMQVVHNGVNLGMFAPEADAKKQEALRAKLGLGTEDRIILYLGSLQPWQDLTTLMRAFAGLAGHETNTVLLIVGDGPERGRMEETARNLGISDRVHFTGHVPYANAAEYINLADVCTLPRTEKVNARIGLSPIKLYSYLACGKPVVASRIGGLEFLEANGLGTLASCGDAEAFAQALSIWLDVTQKFDDRVGQGPTLPEGIKKTAEIQAKARRYAEEHCGWDRTAKAVFTVCRELLEK